MNGIGYIFQHYKGAFLFIFFPGKMADFWDPNFKLRNSLKTLVVAEAVRSGQNITLPSGEAIKPKKISNLRLRKRYFSRGSSRPKKCLEADGGILEVNFFLIGQLFVYKTPFDLWLRNR